MLAGSPAARAADLPDYGVKSISGPNGSGEYILEFISGEKYVIDRELLEKLEAVVNDVSIEDGVADYAGEGVFAGSEADREVALKITEQIRSGEFSSAGGSDGAAIEEFVDSEFSLDETVGTMPSLADLFGAAASGGGVIALGVGAAYAGYKIGQAIGEPVRGLLGIAGTKQLKLEGCNCGVVYLHSIEKKESLELGQNELEHNREKIEVEVQKGQVAYFEHSEYAFGVTRQGWIESVKHEAEECKLPSSEQYIDPVPSVLVGGALMSSVCSSWSEAESNLSEYHLVGSVLGENQARKDVYAGIKHFGWPAVRGFKPGEVTTEVESPQPAEITAPLPNHTIDGVGGSSLQPQVPLIVTTETIEEIASNPREHTEHLPVQPLEPELPQPRPNELATEYKTELESAGWTHVEVSVLPEALIDTSVGPNEVAYSSPAAGSDVPYADDVVIEANPSTAPVPGAGGITEPGFHVPSFGVLCEKFPFGVPCWLVSVMASWSASAEAPEWTIPLESPTRGFISNLKLELKPLDKMMEILRPVFLLMATIGAVIAFGRWALGGTPSSGDSGDE
jgi:hypothetical protein